MIITGLAVGAGIYAMYKFGQSVDAQARKEEAERRYWQERQAAEQKKKEAEK